MFVVPDDYDRAYAGSPHLDRLRARGEVRIYTEPPPDEAGLRARLAPAQVLIPIRERTPLTAARLAALPALRLISMPAYFRVARTTPEMTMRAPATCTHVIGSRRKSQDSASTSKGMRFTVSEATGADTTRIPQ